MRADDSIGGSEAGEGDSGGIGRPARGERNAAERGERVLVGAVVIHEPKFFGAGARTDEGDLRGGDAAGATRKFIDDFVGELMREFANLGIGGRAAIDLADNGLRGGIADVVHPGVDDDFGGSFGEIAEGDEIGIERGVGPGKVAKFAGLREERWLGGIEAGTDDIENATEGEVVANYAGEERAVSGGFRGFGSEIGNGDAGLFCADAGAGAKPGLFLSVEECGSAEEYQCEQKGTDFQGQRRLHRNRPRNGVRTGSKYKNSKNGMGAGRVRKIKFSVQ